MRWVFKVPWAGIEPARPKTLDFESSASTSSATKASGRQKYEFFRFCNIILCEILISIVLF